MSVKNSKTTVVYTEGADEGGLDADRKTFSFGSQGVGDTSDDGRLHMTSTGAAGAVGINRSSLLQVEPPPTGASASSSSSGAVPSHRKSFSDGQHLPQSASANGLSSRANGGKEPRRRKRDKFKKLFFGSSQKHA